ncbi:hypothetical protein CHOTACABRAS_266 [Bacillus phage Chotacabras]|nr:hypothetical protein CHOTACABRAS_266 [Bacillus phage Chotacabras]
MLLMETTQNFLQKFKDFKEDAGMLEMFGQITLKTRSWFKFVRYDDKVHLEAFIEDKKGNINKIEEFGSFYFIENRLAQWIVKIDF